MGKIMKVHMIKKIMLACAFIFLVKAPAFGEPPEEYRIEDSHLHFDAAESNMESIEEALLDFVTFTDLILTDEVLEKLSEEGTTNIEVKSKDIEEIPNLDSRRQYYSFPNWTILVDGFILKMNYETKKLEYELAKCKGKASKKELENLKKAVDISFEKFKYFLSNSSYTD